MIVTVRCESCGKSDSIKALTNWFGVYKLTSMGWVRYTDSRAGEIHWRCPKCVTKMYDELTEMMKHESQTT